MTTSVSLANIAARIDMLEIRCSRCDRAGPLKPSGLVDDIAQRLAPGESSAIVEQNIEPTIVDIGSVPRGMRRDQYIWRRPQRVVRRQWLDLEYINKWSLWLDFKLLVQSIPRVLVGRGAN